METRLIARAALALGAAAALVAASPPVAPDRARLDTAITTAKADMLVDPARAIRGAQVAYALADAQSDTHARAIGRASAQWLMGEAQSRLSNPRAALPLLTSAAGTLAQAAPGTVLQGDILLSLGGVLTDLGRVTDALATLQRAHEVYLRTGQARSRAKALIMIALLYNGARDFESALRYFARASDAYAADDGLLVAIESGRGAALTEVGRYPEAESVFVAAVTIAQRMGSDALLAKALGNVAKVQLLQHHLTDADRTIARGVALTRHEAARSIAPDFVTLGARLALEKRDYARADALITQRFRGVDLGSTTLDERDAHQIAYDLYTRVGHADAALPHLAALKRLDDQATALARSNSAALASARFDYTSQELRIAKLKADDLQKSVAYERSSARIQRNVFAAAALATLLIIGLLALGLFTLRRSRNQTRAANADLETSNTALGKALAAKTEFLATTSHEIRTPLNGILGMTQVMAADPSLDAATRDRISVVHDAGVTMRALVDDILDVAKIETGKMTIEDASFDLAATVRDAARMWREQAQAKGLGFHVDVATAPLWIIGDGARVRQIVFNLLSNAVKFTAAGDVTLTCAVVDDQIRIIVTDTGIGIDPAVHEVIFESFRQADTTTTREFGGTGLGLSICRNLSRAMGGDVSVTSELGQGATFTFAMPLRSTDAPDVSAKDVAVLILERNPIARATLRALLEPYGKVGFADDLADARAMAAGGSPTTLLVDLASAGNDAAAVALLAAELTVSTFLLVPADASLAEPLAGVAVLRRPIAKKDLVALLFPAPAPLVRAAA